MADPWYWRSKSSALKLRAALTALDACLEASGRPVENNGSVIEESLTLDASSPRSALWWLLTSVPNSSLTRARLLFSCLFHSGVATVSVKVLWAGSRCCRPLMLRAEWIEVVPCYVDFGCCHFGAHPAPAWAELVSHLLAAARISPLGVTV